MRADSWTTSQELEEDIGKLLGVENPKPFSLFEVSTGEEERVLDPDERILDLISFWQRSELEEISKIGKSNLFSALPPSSLFVDVAVLGAEFEEFRFMYKVGLFYEVEDTDTSAIELLYVQATHDVVDSRYPCSEQDAVTLAALQMQEAFGDFPSSGTCSYLRGKLGVYLSGRLIEQKTPLEYEEQIYKLYKKLIGYAQMEARLSYLDYVKSWKIYGSTFFFAEPQNNKDLPRECVLAVNNKGILVVDPSTKEFLAEYEYSNVVTWGHSLNSFVIVTGSTNRQIKMYFKTDQGKEINNMVRCYVENRMG
jgi:hypothetical protein